jgi:sugar phosphate isomerase/epimerase
MKLAICNEIYQDRPFAAACEHMAATGYKAVEIAPFTLSENPLELSETTALEAAKTARAAGLDVIGWHWLLAKSSGCHMTTADAGQRRAAVDFLSHLARLCGGMGGTIMVLGSPQQRSLTADVSYDDGFKRMTDACREVCEVAGANGVTLAIEPLGPAETNFIQTAEEGIRLIKAVDHPACGLHLDVKAMSTEPKPIAEVIRDSAEYMAHFHINDPNLGGPGTGDVAYEPIVQALRDINYDGYLSLEVFDFSPGAEAIAEDAMRFMTEQLG